MEVDYEVLCIKYIKNAKIKENGNIYGYIRSEKSFNEFTSKLQDIGYKYSTRCSTIYGKTEGQDGKDMNPFFSKNRDIEAPIEFCGHPFILEYTSHRHCSLGPKYYKKKSPDSDEELPVECLKKRRFRLISTKKIGCQAKMVFRRVKVFTEYYLNPMDGWSKRAKIIKHLRTALNSSEPPAGLVRYYIEMTPEEFHQHPKVTTSATTRQTDESVAAKRTRRRAVNVATQDLAQEEVNDAVIAETNQTGLKFELPDNTFHAITALPTDCDDYVEIVCSTNYAEETATDDTILTTDDVNTQPCPKDSVGVRTSYVIEANQCQSVSRVVPSPNVVRTRYVDTNQCDVRVVPLSVTEPGSVRTRHVETHPCDVQTMQASVRSEVERIVQASYSCENKHVLFEVLSVLKECSQTMEDHQLL